MKLGAVLLFFSGFWPEKVPKEFPDSYKHTTTYPKSHSISLRKSYVRISGVLFCSTSEAPGSPTLKVDIEATSINVSWTKPANNGGRPITAYRVLILQGNTEIQNRNLTNLLVKHLYIGGLNKTTNYTIKLFARNYVFEGKATERKIQTKYEGMKMSNKNAFNQDMHSFIHTR